MKYFEIQDEVIKRYNIDICDGTKCANDWRRTHAHVKEKRVCKWKRANSLESTFTLFHEIGHIETTKASMRRAESEYHATAWAIWELDTYGIRPARKLIERYQAYIDREVDRGQRRGGKAYPRMELSDIMDDLYATW